MYIRDLQYQVLYQCPCVVFIIPGNKIHIKFHTKPLNKKHVLFFFQGTLRADGSRKDVDREFVLYADIVNETNSWLIEESLKRCRNPDRCRQLFNEKNPQFVLDTNIYQVGICKVVMALLLLLSY